jgi:hypothetical protein
VRVVVAAAALGALGGLGCGDLQGLGGSAPPLATMTVTVPTDPGVAGEHLQVALVWGMQWLPELLCSGLVPPEGSDAPVLAAGCRDPFGFVPLRVETNAAVTVGEPTELALTDLPGADVLVGTLDARVAFGSFVLYDDRDQTGNLELARANRLGFAGPGSDDAGSNTPTETRDVVLGASFITMTAPDTRLAYREGAFVPSAFYPRAGCSDPPPAFSIAGAGGFTAQSAIAATIAGMLPPEDPAQCSDGPLAATPVTVTPIAATAPTMELAELACTENTADSSVRYREPDTDSPDLTDRQTACVHVPTLGGSATTPSQIELIVTGRSEDSCAGLTHYVLKGCREDPNCESPDWDHSLAPPTWWPCPSS